MPAVTWKSGASAPRKALKGHGFSRAVTSAQTDAPSGAAVMFFSRTPRTLQKILPLLFALILALAAPLSAKSWHISNFQDTITVNSDGSALVNETISLVFIGEWHGIHRTIPIEYPGPNGTNYQLFVTVTSVTDENGAALKYDSSTSGASRDLKIFIPNATNATRTVQLAYRVRNGTRFFDQNDEFYWNVTGNDWPVPIEQASASVHFPPAPAIHCAHKPSPAFTAPRDTTQPPRSTDQTPSSKRQLPSPCAEG
jgi:hypothetical protein